MNAAARMKSLRSTLLALLALVLLDPGLDLAVLGLRPATVERARVDRGRRRADARRAHPDHGVRLVEARIRRTGPVTAGEGDGETAGLLITEGPVVRHLAVWCDVDRVRTVVTVDARAGDEVVGEHQAVRDAPLIHRVVVQRGPVRAA